MDKINFNEWYWDEINLDYVDLDNIILKRKLPEGVYACAETNGDVIIRDLKKEVMQWSGLLEKRYPYSRGCIGLYDEIHNKSIYEEEQGCYIKDGDVVVDVGANIGMFSRLATDKGASKVYAFEPSAVAVKCAMMNTDLTLVDTYKASIFYYTGFLNMVTTKEAYPMLGRTDEGASATFGGRKVIDEVMVPCYTLDDLISMKLLPEQIDYLKVDVEGDELEVFEGLSDENLNRIDRLSVETHHFVEGSLNQRRLLIEEHVQDRLKSSFNRWGHELFGRGNKGGWLEQLNLWRD